jgi:hypothetical protein
MGNKKSKKHKDDKNSSKKQQKEPKSRLNASEFLRVERQINHIINHFDYEKVHKAMEALNWVWVHPNQDVNTVPTIERLVSTSKYLLRSVATTKDLVCSTGGFTAERYDDGTLHLAFYVTETDAESNVGEPGEP